MSLKIGVPQPTELRPRITVFGVGGAGGNGVNNMINEGLEGVEFVVANTDAQALSQTMADQRIQLGAGLTQGLGAGAQPEVGCAAAEEAIDQIMSHLDGSHMVFVTAGMGGGTGTGAAPVIAKAAKEQGILTVGVVTKPFQFEGARRMEMAEAGIEALQQYVDTLIIIPNQNLFRLASEKTTFAEAFGMADDVLRSGVAGITDLMVMPGLINLDFADVKTVMAEMGKAMMGTGEAEGENRAVDAAESAISNPLLDDVSMKGANGVLINITGGMDMTLFEVDEAANRIRSEVDPDANIIVGSTFSEALDGVMRVSVVATGIDAESAAMTPPRMPALKAARPTPAPAQVQAVPKAEPAAPARPVQPLAASRPTVDPIQQANMFEKAEEKSSDPIEAVAEDDAFIAPEPVMPVEPDEEPIAAEIAQSEIQVADPFAEADMANASRSVMVEPMIEEVRQAAAATAEAEPDIARSPEPQRAKPSLFERMTGLRRVKAEEVEDIPDMPEQEPEAVPHAAIEQPAAPVRVAAPTAPTAPVAPAAEAEPAPVRPLVATQDDRMAPARAEDFDDGFDDDDLKIPAFLKRQAN